MLHPLRHLTWAIAMAAATLLSACGGGGGSGAGGPQVTSTSVSQPKLASPLVVTLNGTNLDINVLVQSATCTNIVRAADSTATQARYTCYPNKVGAQQLTVFDTSKPAGANTLTAIDFTVPSPEVTLTVRNTSGSVDGQVVILLEWEKTPVTAANFLYYATTGFYDGTLFHRLVPGFVVQGGGFVLSGSTLVQKPPTREPIFLEVDKGLSNVQWTVAMARTPERNSATSQFFVNLVDNAAVLDPVPAISNRDGYAVFATITAASRSVVQSIAAVASTDGACPRLYPLEPTRLDCVPVDPIVITKAEWTR